MTDLGLLLPGSHRSRGLVGDEQVLRCLVRAEAAWVQAQADLELVPTEHARALEQVLEPQRFRAAFDLEDLAQRAELGGNAVIPMLADLRAAVREIDPAAAGSVHRGLTSQDVQDTAMMLLVREARREILSSLEAAERALGDLAQAHRGTLSVARTLTQHAMPSTFGLRCAQWLSGVLDAHEQLAAIRLPAAIGGAVGTLAGACDLFPQEQPADASQRALDLHAAWAQRLGLEMPGHVWHTARGPVLGAGSALGVVCAALGKIADDVLLLSRPELAELQEPSGPGRGVSSAMPQKQNPVLSVLLRRTALSAPQHVATLFAAAGSSVDERPDGAWHAEWPALRDLLRLAAISSSQLAELSSGLRVDAEQMVENLRMTGPALLSSRIVPVLKDHVRAHDGASPAQRIQSVLARAGADQEQAIDGLAELVAEGGSSGAGAGAPPDRQRLRELCDPRGSLGASELLIDRALERLAVSTQELTAGHDETTGSHQTAGPDGTTGADESAGSDESAGADDTGGSDDTGRAR